MIYGKLDVHLVELSGCLDWHKVPKICDSQCFLHTKFIMSAILVFIEFIYLFHIVNIKENSHAYKHV